MKIQLKWKRYKNGWYAGRYNNPEDAPDWLRAGHQSIRYKAGVLRISALPTAPVSDIALNGVSVSMTCFPRRRYWQAANIASDTERRLLGESPPATTQADPETLVSSLRAAGIGLNVVFLDARYRVTDRATLTQILVAVRPQMAKPYIPDHRDCDNYAALFAGIMGVEYGISCGLVLDTSSAHAYNVVWCMDNGEITPVVVEPQVCMVVKPGTPTHTARCGHVLIL